MSATAIGLGVGIGVGGSAIILVALFFFFFYRRHHKRRAAAAAGEKPAPREKHDRFPGSAELAASMIVPVGEMRVARDRLMRGWKAPKAEGPREVAVPEGVKERDELGGDSVRGEKGN